MEQDPLACTIVSTSAIHNSYLGYIADNFSLLQIGICQQKSSAHSPYELLDFSRHFQVPSFFPKSPDSLFELLVEFIISSSRERVTGGSGTKRY